MTFWHNMRCMMMNCSFALHFWFKSMPFIFTFSGTHRPCHRGHLLADAVSPPEPWIASAISPYLLTHLHWSECYSCKCGMASFLLPYYWPVIYRIICVFRWLPTSWDLACCVKFQFFISSKMWHRFSAFFFFFVLGLNQWSRGSSDWCLQF